MAPIGGPESCDGSCEGVAAGVLVEVAEEVLDAMDEDDVAATGCCQHSTTPRNRAYLTFTCLDQPQ
jgi:hypothetical protein